MLTAKDIRELRFEKAAWGYRPEDIDEFLGKLEATFQEIDNEREDSNHKIQVLADKVREYMKDEEAIKDALLGAQKEGHRAIVDAQEKADQIIAKAKEEAAVLIDEATVQHEELMEKNRAELAAERQALVNARKMVADFKRQLFDMYKGHLEMISAMPDEDAEDLPTPEEAEEIVKETVASDDPFATSQFSSRIVRDAYENEQPAAAQDTTFGETGAAQENPAD
ncbi:MAG: DivIVA domain-containing protein [Oscillospiraceae bacterium]|nr:DivIVA domain-containing protein [Oscillospiraceae bacterium]